MSMTRRDQDVLAGPERFERGLFDWSFRPLEAWRRLFDDDQIKVEEFVDNGELVVRAELPGVDPERDIDVSIVDGNLRIRAERRHEEKVEDRDYRRSEIRYGSFVRTLPLPTGTSESDVKASYKDGILEVRAPIQESSSEGSKIPVSHSESSDNS
jgi:HSP20 family protein